MPRAKSTRSDTGQIRLFGTKIVGFHWCRV
jgi:hypothetical protein